MDLRNVNSHGYIRIETAPAVQKAKSLGLFGLFSRGSKKSRINLKISDSANDSFNIAAKIQKNPNLKPHEKNQYILIHAKIGNNQTLTPLKINRNSLIKRLGIDKNELKRAEEQGIEVLSKFVSNQTQAIRNDMAFAKTTEIQSISEFKQKFTQFDSKADYQTMENAFREINRIMRVIDPSEPLLHALNKEESRALKTFLKTHENEIKSLKKKYKAIKAIVETRRNSIAERTKLGQKEVRHSVLFGVTLKRFLSDPEVKLNKRDKLVLKEISQDVITNFINTKNIPGFEFLNHLNIAQKDLIKLLESPLTQDNPLAMLKTLKHISEHIQNPEAKTPYYAKKTKGTFGWSTDEQGLIYLRTGIVQGTGSFKKITREYCINTGKEFASAAVKNPTEISAALKGQEMAKILIEGQVPHILKPSLSCFISRTKIGRNKLVMRLPLKSQAAEKLVRNKEKTPIKRIVQIGVQVADTLTAMHRLDYVHNDIKPGNILLSRNKVYVIDLDGVGKEGEFGVSATQRYSPPELSVMEPELKTKAHDAFSLGVLLIDLLTKRRLDKILEGAKGYTKNQLQPNSSVTFTTILKNPGLEKFMVDLNVGIKKFYSGDELIEARKILTIVQGLINPNPEERMTCETALALLQQLET